MVCVYIYVCVCVYRFILEKINPYIKLLDMLMEVRFAGVPKLCVYLYFD